jgi:hypothetical protein
MTTSNLQGLVDRIALLVPDRPWERHVAPNGTAAKIGTRDRWIVQLTALDHGVVVSARRPRERRDERLEARILVEADLDALASPLADLMTWWAGRLTIYSLVPGRLYRVGRELVDYSRTVFHAGEALVFVERHFLPYDGGHTVVFKLPDGTERRMYLQEDQAIVEDLDAYLIEA